MDRTYGKNGKINVLDFEKGVKIICADEVYYMVGMYIGLIIEKKLVI